MRQVREIEAEYWKLMENYNYGEDFDYLARLMQELLKVTNKILEDIRIDDLHDTDREDENHHEGS